MSQQVFPTLIGLAWDVTKTPMFSTKAHKSVSGRELRAAYYSYPLYKFGLKYDVLRSDTVNAELQTLMGFFLARQGSFDTFLFTDPEVNSVTAQGFGTGNGTTTAFQLAHAYGGYSEPVFDLNGTASIYVNGVLKTVTTDYTISSTGLVTFVSAPAAAAALTWTGSFYYRCRFVDDTAEFDNFMYKLWALKRLDLQTVKP